jgi:hypothetical protein
MAQASALLTLTPVRKLLRSWHYLHSNAERA